MTKIYLIRHGEAEGNLYRIWQGSTDGKITPRGALQLEALAKRFQDVPLDALYSSDRVRAMDTALALKRGHEELELQTSPDLREIDVGPWEGVAFANTVRSAPREMECFNNDPDRFFLEGAETFSQVLARMKRILLQIAGDYPDGTVAVASHGMAIRTILAWIQKIPSAEMRSYRHGDNTSVSLVTVEDGEFSVVYTHDNSHLEGDLSTLAKQNWYKNKSGRNTNDLRDEPLKLPKDSLLYIRCYEGSWRAAHGTPEGFVASPYLTAARNHLKKAPDSIVKLYMDEELAGLLELDPDRGKEEEKGWISLLYLRPEYRGKGLGIQLLGRAVMYFRAKGRTAIQLHVSKDNLAAQKFYRKHGFEILDVHRGILTDLYLMEKEI